MGEFVALLVSFCWAASSYAFEKASKKIGSVQVNFLRMIFAFVMLGFYGLIVRGSFFPEGAGKEQWLWLSISGFIGFFIGDLFLFQALTVIGARLTMLVMTTSPALTTLIGFFLLDERLQFIQIAGILLIVLGIMLAFSAKKQTGNTGNVTVKGFLLAFGGAFGQALGLIFSKKGIGDYDPFAATQIRIISGFVFFLLLLTWLKSWKSIAKSVRDVPAMVQVSVGSFFGPMLGVGLSMAAISMTDTGIASALMSLTPIVLVGYSILMRKRVTWMEVSGAVVSVAGVLILFLG